jgi:drug/metabolite transporter (DMT)-like permease
VSGVTNAAGRRPWPGVAVAGVTALVSGVAIFVSSYGVRAYPSSTLYTTAKNIVAVAVLALVAALARRRTGSMARCLVTPWRGAGAAARGPAYWLGLSYVGVVGGGLAFALFFRGLALASPAPAAFWRDTMVLWVALLAVPVLAERVRWWNVAAISLLVAGQVVVTGGVGHLGADRGELYVLASTVLWAGEVVVAKRLLAQISPSSLALVRMGVGALALLSYLAATGALGAVGSLGASQLGWAGLSGVLLAAYVATWMSALARARALDVTSVLVASALVTWLLQLVAGTQTPRLDSLGLVLVALGAGLVLAAHRPRRRAIET